MLPSFFRHWDQWSFLSFAKPTWVNLCMINGAIIVHRQTINVLLHMVGCPLTRPSSNASQKSCSSTCTGFRESTTENILIIYSGINLKVVFLFLSLQPAGSELCSELSSSLSWVNQAPCSALQEWAGCLRSTALFSTLFLFNVYPMDSSS